MAMYGTLDSVGGRGSAIGRCDSGERVSGLDIRPALLRRAEHLPAGERTLLRAVLDEGAIPVDHGGHRAGLLPCTGIVRNVAVGEAAGIAGTEHG